jgi:hypothetical protein
MPTFKTPDHAKLDKVVADARMNADKREKDYREQALKIYPWICGRSAWEFTRAKLRELTVRHRDHNPDNNPPDGSNWEFLCRDYHESEHQKQLEATTGRATEASRGSVATRNPLADLKSLLQKDK